METPQLNQKLDYYCKYLKGFGPDVRILEVKLGWIRWLQGTAINAFLESEY